MRLFLSRSLLDIVEIYPSFYIHFNRHGIRYRNETSLPLPLFEAASSWESLI